MAQGILQSSNENQELEDIGQRYIQELLSTSFFQDVEDGVIFFIRFKMHDLVHALALLVAQTECSIINSHTCNNSKGVRHLSFCEKDFISSENIPTFLLQLDNVRTIVFPVRGGRPISSSFMKTCIHRFKYLHVLDLSELHLEVLSTSIGELRHLRYLDLSRNHIIKNLPNSICKL